ncbi:MAG: hypothetical protein ACK6BG_12805 [Cyanobacteriota bacterium]
MASLKGVTLTLLMGPVAVAPAPRAIVDALESATATQAVGQRSGFQLTFALSKTSPILTDLVPSGAFDPLVRVILVATLNGVAKVLADGPIKRTDLTVSSKPGEYKFVVTGEDVSGYMDLLDFTGFPFPAMPSFARVALMMAKYAAFGVVPLTIPAPFSFAPLPTEKIPSQEGSDYEYANKLAKDAGYEFYVTPGPLPGANTAYWGPQARVGLPQTTPLTIDFDQAGQTNAISLTVDGNQAILPYGHVKVANFSVPVPVPDIGLLKPPLASRPIPPTKVRLLETERLGPVEVAATLLSGRGGAEPVTASGSVDLVRYGRPIDARSLIFVRGASRAYNGLWYVRSVSHALGRGSWRQTFQLSRDGLISQTPRVPT